MTTNERKAIEAMREEAKRNYEKEVESKDGCATVREFWVGNVSALNKVLETFRQAHRKGKGEG